jgi:thioredoxin-related protein
MFPYKLFLTAAVALSSFSAVYAESWTGFDQGFREAKAKNLPVIVDFSTKWCGWCKKMDKDVFSRPDIAARLAAEFSTVRLDAESSTPLVYKGITMASREFTYAMNVEGFPTLIVFDAQGNKLSELTGYVEAKYFIMFMDFIKKGCYKKTTFEQYVRAGGDCR